jgi:DNA-binding helix-hairpin-helix protein with protein kinase domain
MNLPLRLLSNSNIVTLTSSKGLNPAAGSFGVVYEIVEYPDLMGKVIKFDGFSSEKMRLTERDYQLRIINLIKKLYPFSEYPDGGIRFTCPQDVLIHPDSGNFVGYVMSKAQGESWVKSFYRSPTPVPLQFKMHAIADLITTVSILHSERLTIGDWGPLNFWVNPQKNYECTLIDTESYGFYKRNTHFPAPIHLDNPAPEMILSGYPATTDYKPQDIFCMAAMIYKTFIGNHPYDRRYEPGTTAGLSDSEAVKAGFQVGLIDFEFRKSTQSGWVHSKTVGRQREPLTFWMLPAPLQEILLRTLKDGFENPALRPPIKEWVNLLKDICKNHKLIKCEKNHRYFENIGFCPECFPVSFYH